MGAGHSIAVQNFNENLAILVMLAIYSGMVATDLRIYTIMVIFGLFISGTMVLIIFGHRYNQSKADSLHLIGMSGHRD